jgi:beta-N-acetylhexosaminidase
VATTKAFGRTGKPQAVIFGCAGPSLTADERHFFSDALPVGFILFERNCQDPRQVIGLVAELKEITGRPGTPILIDQEGGRVQRLKPPHWRDAPPASVFGRLAVEDLALAREAVELNAGLIATELSDLGINVDCAPVLDVLGPKAHSIIGERAFGNDPGTVTALGRAAAEGFLAGGVLPLMKHIPGHGRALADSHQELPVVDAAAEDLEASDFRPFLALKDLPWAMTAHVVYRALDADHPATTSGTVITKTIRGDIGFDGVLVSDDIGMKALIGSFDERAAAVLAAGCDLVLHCSGDLAEMEAVAAGVRPLSSETMERLAGAEAMRGQAGDWDGEAAEKRLDEILADGAPQ